MPAVRRTALVAAATAFVIVCACDTLVLPLFDTFSPRYRDDAFVNWESPHISPLALTGDGKTLLAVNTADAMLELFDVSGDTPAALASIPVGLDPVSVRVLDERTAWVVNHVSDSVSVVDLTARHVVRTLLLGDEPTDVAFAGGKAFVVCSQLNRVCVYSLADLDADPTILEIEGEDPRAATVTTDGKHVCVAVFESGNHTTLVPWESVSDKNGPYGGVNPPPNVGVEYVPPIADGLPSPPPVSMIVRKNEAGDAWMDDNGGDWSEFITWDQHDHDLAIIDADSLDVRYVTRLMTTNMHVAPFGDGGVVVVGTEALNDRRFEPNLTGRFIHVVAATIDAARAEHGEIVDLNPHLAEAYAAGLPRVDESLRRQSVADPRGVVFSADGTRGYVSGMGSDNVVAIDAGGARLGAVDVGQGPTGLALHEARSRLYVLNRFDASISVVDTQSLAELSRTAFHDSTPAVIRDGRPFLYSARRFGGLGVTSCGSCHLDARTDQLAWDLGNPGGAMKRFNQECNRPFLDLFVGACEDFHPMKGPMTTQTLQNIPGTEPFHWRGDRDNLAEFNPAFVGLLGGERELTSDEMAAFEAFLAHTVFPPNPNRNLDNSLRSRVGDGNPIKGELIYFNKGIDLGFAKCNDCHDAFNGAGTNRSVTPRKLLINPNQSIDVPQIRNMYEKTGFSRSSLSNNVGFGHNHDGVIDGMFNFFHIPNFTGFADGEFGDQERRDIIAYVMSFSTDTHAGVGAQVTNDGTQRGELASRDRWRYLLRIASRGEVGLIARTRIDGRPRGFAYAEGVMLADRAADAPLTPERLWGAAKPGDEQTWTLVPLGAQRRLGIDRNLDGVLNGDE